MMIMIMIIMIMIIHGITIVFSTNTLFILSRIDLIILPASDLEGLINLNVRKIRKLIRNLIRKVFIL